ncbi:MAG: hypothetical protein AAB011_04360 [Candidatus Eisenbacteria bacterium]
MAVYHQMGHDSENLLHHEHLDRFRGAILSPLNYRPDDVRDQAIEASRREGFELIFDPQLYYPSTERGCLRQWPYFPADIDTADPSADGWWTSLVDNIVECCSPLGVQAICSPVIVPRTYDDAYLIRAVDVADRLSRALRGGSPDAIQTIVLGLSDMASLDRALGFASIISRTVAQRVYLVFVGTTEPRRELSDPEELKGAMRLVMELERCGLRVLVGFCSTELILWKHAGASDCATGKFFNLRRFTKSRFEEPSAGGGQLPYWFEESLVAFLRESDVIRMRDNKLFSGASLSNPFCQQILEKLAYEPGAPWIALGWRQFMCWFAAFEERVRTNQTEVPVFLKEVEEHWKRLDDRGVLLEEMRNDGSWVRQWRRAAIEYNK